MGPRTRLRTDDRSGRHRPHTAVSHGEFQDRPGRSSTGSAGRTWRHLVDTASVHGHACSIRRFTSWPWRRTALRHRRAYREFMMKENPKTVQRVSPFRLALSGSFYGIVASASSAWKCIHPNGNSNRRRCPDSRQLWPDGGTCNLCAAARFYVSVSTNA